MFGFGGLQPVMFVFQGVFFGEQPQTKTTKKMIVG